MSQPKMLVDKDIILFMRQEIGYVERNKTCSNCRYFRGTDCSGSAHALDSHCRLNPTFYLPADEGGRCDYFTEKEGAK